MGARALRRDLHRDLARDLPDSRLPKIYVRIGIKAGVAMIGNLGSEERFEHMAIGGSMNLAPRLKGLNKLYSKNVRVIKAMVSHVGERSTLRLVDRIILKAKTAPINVYTIRARQPMIDRSKFRRVCPTTVAGGSLMPAQASPSLDP